MRLPRASGVLLHPTSLPGRHGIGDLGPEAHAFVDFLAATGQRWWQMLPLGPTGFGNSPYQSHSSFAGNPLLIDLDDLVKRGWLAAEACLDDPLLPDDHVDFDAVAVLKEGALRLAYEGFKTKGDDPHFEEFVAANRVWLDDYVLYQALKDVHGGLPWYRMGAGAGRARPGGAAPAGASAWPRGSAITSSCSTHSRSSGRRCGRPAGSTAIMLIGDVPIFVAHDSADVWAQPELFYLDERGQPLVVAGVPPDYFSETGQLWGNPLYRWEAHAADDYSWWVARLRFPARAGSTSSGSTIFAGSRRTGRSPPGRRRRRRDGGCPGRGVTFFEALRRRLGSLPLIAEDLGLITPGVEALRDEFGLPGMRVLQFGFGPDQGADKAPAAPASCPTASSTPARTITTRPGAGSPRPRSRPRSPRRRSRPSGPSRCATCTPTGDEIHWDMIRLAFSSVADTAIIPLAGYPGAGQPRPDEPAGQGRGQLAMAVPERARSTGRPGTGSPS